MGIRFAASCAIQILAGLLVAGVVGTASAADCDAVLIPTKIDQAMSREAELALATLVKSESDYSRAVSSGASGSYGLFSASGNYSGMRQRRDALFNQFNLKMTDAEAQRLVTSFLPQSLAKSWMDCKIASGGGVLVRVQDIAPDAVTIIVDWSPLTGVPVAQRGSVQILGAEPNDVALSVIPESLNSRWTGGFLLKRLPNQALRIVVGIHGKVDTVYVPAPLPAPRCISPTGPWNFSGEKCGGNFHVSGQTLTVTFGDGKSTNIPKNNPAYKASLGFWLAGDFNGDGIADLIHFVVKNPGHENYVHVHFSSGGGNFSPPTGGFSFPVAAKIPEYDANPGYWSVRDVNGDGLDDLVHDPKNRDGRIHVWTSNGDGTFQIRS